MKKLSSVVLAQQGTVILEPEQSPPIATADNLWVRAEAYSTMHQFLENAITISVAVRNTAEGTYLGNEQDNLSIAVEVDCHTGEALAVGKAINAMPIPLDGKPKPFNILTNISSPVNQALGIACCHYINSKK
jgi:hypothetical protein